MKMGTGTIIIAENLEPPTEEEIREYAETIGIKKDEEDLLWIAVDALTTPLPKSWKHCMIKTTGRTFYHNYDTGVSVWEHPANVEARRNVKIARESMKEAKKATKEENNESEIESKNDKPLKLPSYSFVDDDIEEDEIDYQKEDEDENDDGENFVKVETESAVSLGSSWAALSQSDAKSVGKASTVSSFVDVDIDIDIDALSYQGQESDDNDNDDDDNNSDSNSVRSKRSRRSNGGFEADKRRALQLEKEEHLPKRRNLIDNDISILAKALNTSKEAIEEAKAIEQIIFKNTKKKVRFVDDEALQPDESGLEYGQNAEDICPDRMAKTIEMKMNFEAVEEEVRETVEKFNVNDDLTSNEENENLSKALLASRLEKEVNARVSTTRKVDEYETQLARALALSCSET